MMMTNQERRFTVETFWNEYAGKPYQLIRGRVVEVKPSSYMHGTVTSRVVALLYGHVRDEHGGGVVAADTGFVLAEDALCSADCAFISTEKVALILEPEKYLPFAPDMMIEIVSLDDAAVHVRDKIALFRAAGTRLIWVVYPSLRRVDIHRADGTACEAGLGDQLDGGDLLPDLQIRVSDLFPAV